MLFLDEPTESWHHLESCPCGDCMWYYIYKKPSVSPNTAEFPMLSHLLPSSLCPYCGFACKGLAEARGMWHTGGEVSQPLTQDTGTIPLIHPPWSVGKKSDLTARHNTWCLGTVRPFWSHSLAPQPDKFMICCRTEELHVWDAWAMIRVHFYSFSFCFSNSLCLFIL